MLVRKGRDRPFLHLVSSLLSQEKIPVLLGLLILIFLAEHVVWLAERSTVRQETTFSHTSFPGVFEGMYWALVTASTIGYGDKVPHRWTGRIGAALVIFISLPLFSFFIAQLSSDLVMQQLRTRLHGPEDVPGKRVAGLPAAAYGGYKDAREAGAAGVLRLGAVPEEPREAREAWVALMGADGHRLRAEAERLAWAGLQVRRETT